MLATSFLTGATVNVLAVVCSRLAAVAFIIIELLPWLVAPANIPIATAAVPCPV